MLREGRQFFDESQQRSFDRGWRTGLAKAIVSVLEARDLTLTDEQREEILACTDLAELDRWLDLAVTAASADELFKD